MMKHKVQNKPHDHVAEECHHYWMIEMANGPKSRGICKYCGESRDFLNSMPDIAIPKRRNHPLDLPEMTDVELDDGSES